jgi:mono/diheme cytochrome c family protein
MKRFIYPAFFIMLFISGIIITNSFTTVQTPDTDKLPKNVKSIVDKSCFGCHNSESTNDDAKEALDFDTFNELRRVRKITKLKEIAEVVTEGEMPPKRFLEKFPEKSLTDEERQALISWTKSETDRIIKN